MSELTQQQTVSPQQPEEQEIDLIELAQKVWAERKLVFKACGIAVIVALVVAFSIPKEYATSVTLAPETGGLGLWPVWQALTWEPLPGKMPCRRNFIRIS